MARFIVGPNFIIDVDALAAFIFKQLKASVAAEDIQSLLPFQTALELGDTHVHITNLSAYPVATKYHVITFGETLCKRAAMPRGEVRRALPTCPGCLAKARGVIVNNLLKQFEGDALAVADALKQVEQAGFFRV
jgi:hypothetical protein